MRIFRLLHIASLAVAIPLASHAQTAPPAKCRYELLGHLPLEYHGVGLAVTTGGEINGTPARLLVDTGAGTLLTRYGVERRNLRMDPGAGWGAGVGGETRYYSVPIRSFTVGPVKSSGRGVLPMIDETGVRPTYDAIAGAGFLLQRDVEFALAEKKIRFFNADNCRDAFLAYWDANAVQLPLELGRDGARPVVKVQIDGVTFRALIDSGAAATVMSMQAAQKLGLSADSPGMTPAPDSSGVGAALVRTYRYRFKTFAIGHETIQHPELMVAARHVSDVDILLGNDFMRSHRILLSPSQQKIYLSYIGGTPFSSGVLDDWVVRAAQEGNGYAQFRVAMGMARQKKADESREWMDRAVQQGIPPALRHRAIALQKAGDFGGAVDLLEKAIADDPYDMTAQLQLFRARVQAGPRERAESELAGVMKRLRGDGWPMPLAEYYLGRMDIDRLLKEANEEKLLARQRQCDVFFHVGELFAARADAAAAAEWKGRRDAECKGSLAGAP